MKNKIYNTNCDEQVTRAEVKLNPNFAHRVSVLDTSYNMGMTGFNDRYKNAVKPLKVAHFHPNDEKQWNYMVEGKNDLGVTIVNNRLSKLLKKLK